MISIWPENSNVANRNSFLLGKVLLVCLLLLLTRDATAVDREYVSAELSHGEEHLHSIELDPGEAEVRLRLVTEGPAAHALEFRVYETVESDEVEGEPADQRALVRRRRRGETLRCESVADERVDRVLGLSSGTFDLRGNAPPHGLPRPVIHPGRGLRTSLRATLRVGIDLGRNGRRQENRDEDRELFHGRAGAGPG